MPEPNRPKALDPSDAALVDALRGPLPGEAVDADLLTRDELAAASGLSPALLETLEREGLLTPRDPGPPPRYARADADMVAAGMALVEAGLPLGELLDLARRTDDAMRPVARHAVELFLRFVRDPVQGTAASSEDAAASLLGAFQQMLPATEQLVGTYFRHLLLSEARERIGAEAAEGRDVPSGPEGGRSRGAAGDSAGVPEDPVPPDGEVPR